MRDGKPTFVYDGGGMGKGGAITMTANGKKVAEGRLERTVPVQLTLGEGLDIGKDGGSPVDFTYTMPFAFTGTIEKVTIELKPKPTDMQAAAPSQKASQGASAETRSGR